MAPKSTNSHASELSHEPLDGHFETSALIRSGAALSLAGPEGELDELPCGNRVAGTIPYFMDADGGVVSQAGQVFVTPLPTQARLVFAHCSATHTLSDGKLTLVGDFGGAHINVSTQSVDQAVRRVTL